MNTFVKQIIAMITGDTATETAMKIKRQAESALKVQIANREAETVNLESAVEDAKAEQLKAFVNYGKTMETTEARAEYVRTLVSAEQRISDAQEALETHLTTLEFLRGKLAEVSAIDVTDVENVG
jgi:sugar diacid utilization regulator